MRRVDDVAFGGFRGCAALGGFRLSGKQDLKGSSTTARASAGLRRSMAASALGLDRLHRREAHYTRSFADHDGDDGEDADRRAPPARCIQASRRGKRGRGSGCRSTGRRRAKAGRRKRLVRPWRRSVRRFARHRDRQGGDILVRIDEGIVFVRRDRTIFAAEACRLAGPLLPVRLDGARIVLIGKGCRCAARPVRISRSGFVSCEAVSKQKLHGPVEPDMRDRKLDAAAGFLQLRRPEAHNVHIRQLDIAAGKFNAVEQAFGVLRKVAGKYRRLPCAVEALAGDRLAIDGRADDHRQIVAVCA